MEYTLREIANITGGNIIQSSSIEKTINNIVFDSRKITFPSTSLFIALKSNHNDGHNYIKDAIEKGILNVIIDSDVEIAKVLNINILKVDSTLNALQRLAQYHRKQFQYPVLAITGSNGKTIIKEWLHLSLSKKILSVQSPRSYNSQLGVPLSLLQLDYQHEFAIIEAGISQPGEMSRLERMIKPKIGIITNIGDAHSEGFVSIDQKLEEKLTLFKESDTIIYKKDDNQISNKILSMDCPNKISWGQPNGCTVEILESISLKNETVLSISYNGQILNLKLAYTESYMIDNAMHVITTLLHLGWNKDEIQASIKRFNLIPRRLEMRLGLNNCNIINDSYSSDLSSFRLALEYMDNQSANKKRIVIMSGFKGQKNLQESYSLLDKLFHEKKLDECHIIGLDKEYHSYFTSPSFKHYNSIEKFLSSTNFKELKNSNILIKGSSHSKLGIIINNLSAQVHQTVLETNFSSIEHNLNFYRSKLQPDTMIMAIIKAEAYGTGSIPLSKFLSEKKINYLGVALIDEAIKIRNAGVTTPIMVLNVQENSLEKLWEFKLEPEIYNLRLLRKIVSLSNYLKKGLEIHLKIDSGMRRLGFLGVDVFEAIELIKNCKWISIKSIFSHLSSSENSDHDEYSLGQINLFNKISEEIISSIGYKPKRHILNTSGIIRFAEAQFDMVRLGLGLYGVDDTQLVYSNLEKVHTLKSRILQIKTLQPDEATGYGRSGQTSVSKKIAIVSIGYADGLMRLAGNANYSFLIDETLCPTIGNICMDVSMIDVTSVPNVNEGDEVIIFDENLKIEKLAEACKTISYEILSRIAPRVKRTYIYN